MINIILNPSTAHPIIILTNIWVRSEGLWIPKISPFSWVFDGKRKKLYKLQSMLKLIFTCSIILYSTIKKVQKKWKSAPTSSPKSEFTPSPTPLHTWINPQAPPLAHSKLLSKLLRSSQILYSKKATLWRRQSPGGPRRRGRSEKKRRAWEKFQGKHMEIQITSNNNRSDAN